MIAGVTSRWPCWSGLLPGLAVAGCLDGPVEVEVDTRAATLEVTGNSSRSPYLIPLRAGVTFEALLSVGDTGIENDYPLVGIPDGLGIWRDRHEVHVLVNHELSGGLGAVRAHGARGAFVSRWRLDAHTGEILGGSDLIQQVVLWDPIYRRYLPPAIGATLQRFCSGDLATSVALRDLPRDPGSGAPIAMALEPSTPAAAAASAPIRLGYSGRMFLTGEEVPGGRAFAHDVDSGVSYELPVMGKMGFENVVARPAPSPWTVVAATDDSVPGEVVIYRGRKRLAGTPVERAGLTSGRLHGLVLPGLRAEPATGVPRGTRFTTFDLGDVRVRTGAELQAIHTVHGVTGFARPEDAAWNPANPDQLFFATTGFGAVPTRLWRATFDDGSDPGQGGVIDILIDGSRDLIGGVAPRAFDNLAVTRDGRWVYLQEDPGATSRLARIWRYDLSTETLELVAEHDPARFTPGAPDFLTIDEESSGIVDASAALGPGRFLVTVQAHRAFADPTLVEHGQLLLMTVRE